MRNLKTKTRGLMLGALATLVPLFAVASDHNEPAPDPVWPSDRALHKEWDLSDLFAWYDASTDRFNVIVAWHPQQLPRETGDRVPFSDQVLFKLHLRYERAGAQAFTRYFDREITFRYGLNDDFEWGMLIDGLPGLPPQVLDVDSPKGWRAHEIEVTTDDGKDVIDLATGHFDDPFVFDIDGYNASLARALDGEVGLKFDPQNDTFEGHNMTATVLSLPMSAMVEHWEDFDPGGATFGLFPTEKVHVWATTYITEAEAAREEAE